MVKLYYISVLYKDNNNRVINLKSVSDISSFGYFQKKSVLEFMEFTSKLCAERSEKASRSSVREKQYMCHIYVRGDGLTGIILSDNEYPQRVAQNLLNKILDEFTEMVSPEEWPNIGDNSAQFTALPSYLAKYQNPRLADGITKLQDDLDQTKIIVHNTIGDILKRGENLDQIIATSEELNTQSKMFYTTVQHTNRCCTDKRKSPCFNLTR